VLALLFPLVVMTAVEVERVLAVVNGVPIIASDAELAEAAVLVPRQVEESDAEYRRAVVEALVDLELRWQDLTAAGITARVQIDPDAAWRATVQRAGGEDALHRKLAEMGLGERELRELLRHAAVVQAYVASRFAPFVRPTPQEVEAVWRQELAPQLEKAGKPVPVLAEVRGEVEALLRERKLSAEIERWTADLAKRGEIVRYLPRPAEPAAPQTESSPPPAPTAHPN
jgi:hypothetical protein